ncbi:MAG: DUF2079 domain-containing protein [Candidatus Izemoplasmatales bacterium]
MVDSTKWSLKYFIRYAFIAFFLMSSFFLLLGSKDLYYYNIKLATINHFIVQISVFLGLFILLLGLHKFLLKINIHTLFTFFMFIYILIFIIKAPAFSLIVGGIMVSIPLISFTIKSLIKDKVNPLNQYMLILNILIFFTMVIFLLIRVGYDYPQFVGDNLSMIGHGKIMPEDTSHYLVLGSVLTLVFLIFLFKANQRTENKSLSKVYLSLGIVFVILEVIGLSIIMVYRTKIFATSTFDFGLFAQMFYNMKNFNGMVTTLERSVLLSHNAVHISPIFYLMLPVYMVFPSIETLQVLQVIVVAIGVIPLYLIGKHLKLTNRVILIMVSVYIFHPAIISSSFYDLHENCFLGPLLLFVFYFGLKQKWLYLIISFILTLMIKEDASLYLVFLGLFFFFNPLETLDKKENSHNKFMAILMILLSLIYFFTATAILNAHGDGAQFWRFNNLNAYPDFGILGVGLSLFQAPSYWLATMFSPNKIYHLLIIFSVMGFIPLYNTKLSRYWLIIPLLVLNFSSTYPFQHQFGFQYYYGTITLIIIMMFFVFKDKQIEEPFKSSKIIGHGSHTLILLALLLFGYFTLKTKNYYIEYYQRSSEMYDSMKETLTSVPSNKKVLATGYLTPYLSEREVLYDYSYYDFSENDIEFDYVFIDKRMGEDKYNRIKIDLLLRGYQVSDMTTEYIIILEPET